MRLISFGAAGMMFYLTAAMPRAGAVDTDHLQALLTNASVGPHAAVLLVSTPEGRAIVTHGRKWRHGPKVEASDRFVLASVSKPYLAAALLHADVPLDRPVTELFSQQMTRGFRSLKRLTLRHLLAMRSGLPDYLTDGYVDRIVRRSGPSMTLDRALNHARGRPPLFAPDRRFDYSNTNYLLAQAVLERATGKPMYRAFQSGIFARAGLKATAVLNAAGTTKPDVAGYEDLFGEGEIDVRPFYHAPGFGDGGLIASAEDVARFFRALLLEGRVLRPGKLQQMLKDLERDGYGLGIDIERRTGLGTIYGHSGGDLGFVSDVRVIPSRGIVVVALLAHARANSDVTQRVLDLLGD